MDTGIRRSLLAVVALAAACGGPTGQPGDAPYGDDGVPIGDAAGPDATTDATPDAPNDAARVEASSIDGPLAGVTVAFLDASDSVVSVGTTAADGTLTGAVPTGGSVIAASPAGDRAFMWRAVEGGDVLRARFNVETATHDVTFTLPLGGGSGDYWVTTRCGSNQFGADSNQVTITLPVSCTSSDVIAHFRSGVTVRALRVTAQDLTASSIDLTAVPWLTSTNHALAVTSIPSSLALLSTTIRAGELLMFETTTTLNGAGPLGDKTVNTHMFAFAGAEAVDRLDFGANQAVHVTVRRGPTPPAAAIDAEMRLVTLGNAVYTSAMRRMTWEQGSVGDPVDAARATIVFERAGLSNLTWDILQPGATASAQAATIPALPVELAGVDPGTASSWMRQISGYAAPGGYDRVRAMLFGIPRVEPGCFCTVVEIDRLLTQPGTLHVVGTP